MGDARAFTADALAEVHAAGVFDEDIELGSGSCAKGEAVLFQAAVDGADQLLLT